MKLIRLLILFGNLSLVIVIAYLGYYFFFPKVMGGSGYFDYMPIVVRPIEPLPNPRDAKKARDGSEYAAINAWLGSAPREEEVPSVPPPPEQDVDKLKREVQIKSVVYNPLSPSRSGVHLLVSGGARFFLSGDNEQLSPTLDFVLADVKEVTPGQEYIVVFQKGDGKTVELPYKKSER
jgi:hypothetical protein